MPITLTNPAGLPQVELYRQVSVATGTRLVHVAGQVARDAEGGKVGEGDLAAQVEHAYRNVATALAAVGSTFDDVAKLTVYLVDWTPDKMGPLADGLQRATSALGVTATPPVTAIGVAALFEPDILVEIEAVAMLP